MGAILSSHSSEHEMIQSELDFIVSLLAKDQKSYSLWHHRRCVLLVALPEKNLFQNLLLSEIKALDMLLNLDNRNCPWKWGDPL